MDNLDPEFLEKLIIKSMFIDKNYLLMITNVFESEYFEDHIVTEIFSFLKKHTDEFNSIPERSIVVNSLEDKSKVNKFFEEIDSIEFSVSKNYNYLIQTTNDYLKNRAIRQAVLNSVDIIQKNDNIQQIKEIVENALCKDLKIDIGLDYFGTLGERLKKMIAGGEKRIPSYFPQFDEFLNGGFPPYTLSVILAKIHSGKSNTMVNLAARQVLHKHDVVLMSLEMSQNAFAQRFDSVFSLLDINRIYISKSIQSKMITRLKDIKNNERGNLFIKEFPTGAASVNDFRIYLRELFIRGIKPEIIYVDYINLMRPSYQNQGQMYQDVKKISEELRALSLEFYTPVVSVSQLNRDGGFIGLKDLSFNYIAESLGIAATADFLAIYGEDEDQLIYNSEMHYKIEKNRLGGRVGEINKFFLDSCSLKMYDSTELDVWQKDAESSGHKIELSGNN